MKRLLLCILILAAAACGKKEWPQPVASEELIQINHIEARRDLPREGLSVTAAADHPYDRDAARAYMLTWVGKRNPAFMAYDDYGGNCMNFGSQVLAAGGIPMDTNGGYETGWY